MALGGPQLCEAGDVRVCGMVLWSCKRLIVWLGRCLLSIVWVVCYMSRVMYELVSLEYLSPD